MSDEWMLLLFVAAAPFLFCLGLAVNGTLSRRRIWVLAFFELLPLAGIGIVFGVTDPAQDGPMVPADLVVLFLIADGIPILVAARHLSRAAPAVFSPLAPLFRAAIGRAYLVFLVALPVGMMGGFLSWGCTARAVIVRSAMYLWQRQFALTTASSVH